MTTPRTTQTTPAPWSVVIDQGEIGPQPLERRIQAGEADCRAIAAHLDIVGVENLNAEFRLSRTPGNKAVIHVEGVLKAGIVQKCVITQSPVKSYIEEEFEGWYADPASFVSFAKARNERSTSEGEVQVLEEREDPEPIINGKIDLGDMAVQYLSLSLPEYPRAHGAVWAEGTAPEPTPRENPFAALKALKDQ